MTLPKQILSVGLVWTFVFVVLSAGLACADIRPFGLHQPGRAHAGGRAGLGRTAAHNLKAGFFVAKDDDSSRPRKNLYKDFGFAHDPACVNRLAWVPETYSPSPRSFSLDLSPVLNL